MGIEIGPLKAADLEEADRIFRVAFGTFLGMPDPSIAFGDTDTVRSRWRARNTLALAARQEGVLVGSNIVTRWGSLGLFGPLTVRPDLWDRGIARALLDETVAVFEGWKVSLRGLFTFPQSPKHISLYQRYGFCPRYLTFIWTRSPLALETASPVPRLYSQTESGEAREVLLQCREISEGAFPGLDLEGEILSAHDQQIGDTILLFDDSRLEAFAVCQEGAGSEAGSEGAYVKFGLSRPGPGSLRNLSSLIAGAEAFAASRGRGHLEIGCNASHPDACRLLRTRGYKIEFIGVSMHSPDEPGYHRPEVTLVDDWR